MAVKKPRGLAADRARRFCAALSAEAEGRPSAPWWSSIQVVARRLGIPYDEAVALADECARAGLVTHDQSQHTKTDRKATALPHSVTLKEAGRQRARGKR